MKTLIIGILVCVTMHFNSCRLWAQGGQAYFGVIGGMSTLSADGRSVTTSEGSSVSLYNPMNGPAINVFGGWSLSNYVSFQGNYIWNKNSLTLTSAEALVGGVRFYERARGQRIRPYLSTGVGLVRFESTLERILEQTGGFSLPPVVFSDTTVVLRSAVGMDIQVSDGWAVRYSFSEFIGPNPISRQISPPGQRVLMNFQNLVGIVRSF